MRQKNETTSTVTAILTTLDTLYGTTKETFYHHQPWQLLTAIMLSAQSTDKQVEEALPALFTRFPSVELIAEADTEEIEANIRSIGLYKNKAKNIKKCCGQMITNYDGQVPATIEELLTLAGVGRKTATLYLADAYGIAGVTVDTHVFRIAKASDGRKGRIPRR